MEADQQNQIAFYLTGQMPKSGLEPIEGRGLRSALFARYQDLASLRYDFPLVLVSGPSGKSVRSLSSVVESAVKSLPPSEDQGRLEKYALRIERQVRSSVAKGENGQLSGLMSAAIKSLQRKGDDAFQANANLLSEAVDCDGELADCNAELPKRLLRHLWSCTQEAKARRFHEEVDRLVLKLSDILGSDFVNSKAGRTPEKLKASVGGSFAHSFDFAALSRLAEKSAHIDAVPRSRRKRIEKLLAVLGAQRFFPATAANDTRTNGAAPYNFVYESGVDALAAYQERLPKAVELSMAIAIAELEIEGEYREDWHDPIFEAFGANGLDQADLARFPDYLVCANAKDLNAEENARLLEALASGLPIKVLVQTDDILQSSTVGDGHFSFGLPSRQLTSTAMSLSDVFVLQTCASHLLQDSDRIGKGLSAPGAALFSVYSGAGGKTGDIPPYLVAAAAMESRAFPGFTYDPHAGLDWATRFEVHQNPQAKLDWPVHGLSYEAEGLENVSVEIPFTLLDFVAMDGRFAGHFARTLRESWTPLMATAVECLDLKPGGIPGKVPFLYMVDAECGLHKVLADEAMLRETRRCLSMWRSLQELGGIHNSHADRLLAEERLKWEAQQRQSVELPPVGAAPMEEVGGRGSAELQAAGESLAAVAETPAEEEKSDDPYIETARCSTCNECTNLNNRMFAYNENKQAFIKDLDAGTFRQLVEAAEACQVGIIHPGKPRNLSEPELDELIKRAEAFL